MVYEGFVGCASPPEHLMNNQPNGMNNDMAEHSCPMAQDDTLRARTLPRASATNRPPLQVLVRKLENRSPRYPRSPRRAQIDRFRVCIQEMVSGDCRSSSCVSIWAFADAPCIQKNLVNTHFFRLSDLNQCPVQSLFSVRRDSNVTRQGYASAPLGYVLIFRVD
jgi:hypothetical protein